MTRDSAFKRRVRARMDKTGESYAAARAHLDTREPMQAAVDTGTGVLHVTNGDSTVERLRAGALADPILPWRDVLHEGPVPGSLDDSALRETRARFLAGPSGLDEAAILRDLATRDTLLAEHAAGDLVLWFEADLYDQLQVVQILDRLRRLGADPARISLVSAGEYPGIAHFGGLGQLQADDLIRLRDDAVPVTPETLELAATAWSAFTSTDPSGLRAVARSESPVLRYLGEAFGRLMQEYPSVTDGLSLTQRRLLLLVEDGAPTPGEAFRELGRRERRPYLGDTICYEIIGGLASGRQPLLALGVDEERADLRPGADAEFPRLPLRLTGHGHDVLASRADHLALNGIDRWIGGVHLTDPFTAWRYDDRREELVRPG